MGLGNAEYDERVVAVLETRAAEPAHRALLDGLEELGLQAERHETDLVEKHGAAVGGLEQAGLGLARIREGATLVAEQLGFEERLRDGGAVDVHEGAGRARPDTVDGPSDQPLAGPRLALDQDGKESRQAAGPLKERADVVSERDDRRAFSDQL